MSQAPPKFVQPKEGEGDRRLDVAVSVKIQHLHVPWAKAQAKAGHEAAFVLSRDRC